MPGNDSDELAALLNQVHVAALESQLDAHDQNLARVHSRGLYRRLLRVVLQHEHVHHHVKHGDQQLHYIAGVREAVPNDEEQRLAKHIEQTQLLRHDRLVLLVQLHWNLHPRTWRVLVERLVVWRIIDKLLQRSKNHRLPNKRRCQLYRETLVDFVVCLNELLGRKLLIKLPDKVHRLYLR